MRSCLVFPHAMKAHSGTYVCRVNESVNGQTDSASITVTVLGETGAHTHTKVKHGCWADDDREDRLLYKPLQFACRAVFLLKEITDIFLFLFKIHSGIFC